MSLAMDEILEELLPLHHPISMAIIENAASGSHGQLAAPELNAGSRVAVAPKQSHGVSSTSCRWSVHGTGHLIKLTCLCPSRTIAAPAVDLSSSIPL